MIDISYTPTTWVNDVTALNATRMNHIETGIDDVDQALADHLADTTAAHAASSISIVDAGTLYTATDVEGALQEIGSISAGLFDAYACYQDQKSAGTAGGSSTSGSWQTRTLNTEVFDPASIGSLSSNAVTLSAGSYFLRAESSFGATGNSGAIIQLRIRNTTGSTTVAVSPAQRPGSANTVVDDSTILLASGRLVAAGTVAIEVQYQTTAGVSTSGLGWAGNFGETEVFTTLVIYREA